MPRANRYHLPGYVWHLTHRCHKREFLLKFARDRDRYCYWLFQARKRFGLCVLDFAITSNHVHLLVKDTAPNVIAQSLQLVAGRTAQEYNQRKGRKGAYWEDRYHATAVQADGHLARCMAYIDLNMVRAGVVSRPAEWAHGGYAQIQTPPARYGVIDIRALCELFGFGDVAALQGAQREWVDESLRSDGRAQVPEWANAIAVGSPDFVAKAKSDLGIWARHRHVDVSGTTGVLREPEAAYRHEMAGENGRLSVKTAICGMERQVDGEVAWVRPQRDLNSRTLARQSTIAPRPCPQLIAVDPGVCASIRLTTIRSSSTRDIANG